ncbi:unnamed protein product [Larinioides sclopetarius]|uniref:Caspase-8 n=2 Tax=Larinioides sclopetarius TaxID=280406 RepID=A0AAV2AVE7_9ARAC
MNSDHTDVGGLTQRFSEILYDQVLVDVTASVPEIKETLLATEDQLKNESKYGDCYIFDYQEFQDGSPLRPGSEKDVKRLSHDFTELDFNVYSNHLNYTKERTLDTLKKAAKNVSERSNCFVCCFLTHGDEGKLLMNDGYLEIEEILKCFSRSACKNLAGKPKIFIFQACRGRSCEEGVFCDSTDSGSEISITDYLDFLLVYSTYEGKYSFKTKDDEHPEKNHGSFFIDELCSTLEQFSKKLNFLEILTIVNYRLAHFYLSCTDKKKTNRKKQMPCFTSRLTTEIKFDKPIDPFSTDDTKYFDERRQQSYILGLRKKKGKDPFEDKQIYNIQKSRIKFLYLENNFGSRLNDCVSYLWSCVDKTDYQIKDLKSWSEGKLMDFLNKVAVQDCSNTDCLICFVACQGKGNDLCDKNGNWFLKQNIVEQFTGKACKDLRGKPKIFIFLMSSPPKKSWLSYVLPKKSCLSCVNVDSTDGNDFNMIPEHSDLLEVSITIQEIKQSEGVIEKFCNIFGSENSEDFISQLTKMNDELVRDFGFYSLSSKKLATFYLNSTLTETLILNNPK